MVVDAQVHEYVFYMPLLCFKTIFLCRQMSLYFERIIKNWCHHYFITIYTYSCGYSHYIPILALIILYVQFFTLNNTNDNCCQLTTQ